MLFLTDRPEQIDRLHRALNAILPCTVASALGATSTSSHSLVICDVDFGGAEALSRMRVTLDRSREDDAPLLCLLRDPSHLTFTRAQEMGATAVLSGHIHPAELAARVRQLLASRSSAGAAVPIGRVAHDTDTALKALTDLFTAVQARRAISKATVHAGAIAALSGVKPTLEPWLDAVRRHDDVTYQHCLLVTGLTAAFAVRMGLSLDHQHLLAQAALVHDIGKASIPTAILNKPGQLSIAEVAVMQTHAALGQAMLARQPGIDPRLIDIVRHHHEFLDGSGYPDGLRGSQISAMVRAVTICDIYAALIERRAYKQPMDPLQAFTTLEAMGDKLDRGLVALFSGMVTETARNVSTR